MTEQPAEIVPDHPFLTALDDAITRARAFQTVVVPNTAPVVEQVWLGNEPEHAHVTPVRDPAMAAGFDRASDSYDAVGSALEDGRLRDAKYHAYNFLAAITQMQQVEAASSGRG